MTNLTQAALQILCAGLLVVPGVDAASIQVEWFNNAGTELLDFAGAPLTSGGLDANDGAVLELGYYSLGTSPNPFHGAWVPLTGPRKPFNGISTIGDKAVLNLIGRFDLGTTFSDHPGDPPPPPGIPFVIRFYDSTSLETSTFFNAVSNDSSAWNSVEPTDPATVLTLTLSDPGLVWQDGPDSAFRTTIPIPEPATSLLAAIALGTAMLRRRSARAEAPRPHTPYQDQN